MKKVLVTGAGGFVGANLARLAVERGHEAVLAVRPGSDRWRLSGLEGRARVVEADLTADGAAERLLEETGPDWVFHLAAHGAYSWQEDKARIDATNLGATVALAGAAVRRGCRAFVHAGTSSEYGLKDHAPSEDEACEPNSAYAASKLAATNRLRELARASGAPLCVLRLYSVYGPWEEPGRLIPQLAARGLEGRWPPLSGGGVARDFVFVDDACEAFLLAAERGPHEPGAVYNVATGIQTSIAQAAETAGKVLGLKGAPEFGTIPDRKWDTMVWVGDAGLIGEKLGWRAHTGFSGGFARTVDWFRANPGVLPRYAGKGGGKP